MSNFQSWQIQLSKDDLRPPFSQLALETEIWIKGKDRPRTILNIESDPHITNKEKSRIIATVMTGMITSKKRKDSKEWPLTFNYNHQDQPKQLAKKEVWKKYWQQKKDGRFVIIDLAKKINNYYENGGSNISMAEDLDGQPTEFLFKKQRGFMAAVKRIMES